jgi:hypothetical protein
LEKAQIENFSDSIRVARVARNNEGLAQYMHAIEGFLSHYYATGDLFIPLKVRSWPTNNKCQWPEDGQSMMKEGRNKDEQYIREEIADQQHRGNFFQQSSNKGNPSSPMQYMKWQLRKGDRK